MPTEWGARQQAATPCGVQRFRQWDRGTAVSARWFISRSTPTVHRLCRGARGPRAAVSTVIHSAKSRCTKTKVSPVQDAQPGGGGSLRWGLWPHGPRRLECLQRWTRRIALRDGLRSWAGASLNLYQQFQLTLLSSGALNSADTVVLAMDALADVEGEPNTNSAIAVAYRLPLCPAAGRVLDMTFAMISTRSACR